MASHVVVSSNAIVAVLVTSTANKYGVERRYDRGITIGALKSKLELVTGAFAATMQLSVYKDDKLISKLDNDENLLGSYHIDDGMTLHAEDKSLKGDEYLDVSKVEKFEISEDEYKKRTDSVRAFKERMKLGQFDKETVAQKEEEARLREQAEEDKAKTLKVDDRCEARVPGQPKRRGVVKYVGTTDFKPGQWVGVQYDEPHGKNNGSVGGRSYFTCPPKYGGFVRPSNLEVGEFPEEAMEFDDDEM